MVITEKQLSAYFNINQILFRFGLVAIWNEDLSIKELQRLEHYSFSVESEEVENV